MSRFGAPTNFCAQRPESLLISAAKQPERHAQKRHQGIDYELQAAQRLAASGIIDTAYERIFATPSPASHDDVIVQSESPKLRKAPKKQLLAQLISSSLQPSLVMLHFVSAGQVQLKWSI